MKIIGNEWDNVLADEFSKPYFLETLMRVDDEYAKAKVYPPQKNVFNALKYTDFNNVKVVILGQDPYHGAGQAHGLCFSVMPGVEVPPSLKNIFTEINNELGINIPNHGCLISWAKQGVLLLNTILTVREGQPQSHKNIGWLAFTNEIIRLLSEKRSGLIFMLWGRNAIDKKSLIDETKHHVLTCAHPSPLSAYNGFFGCGHFIKCNEILKREGKKEIDWSIKNI